MRYILALSIAVLLAGCGADTGASNGYSSYVDEANAVCSPVGGIISYAYGDSYDVVICKDGRAHEVPAS